MSYHKLAFFDLDGTLIQGDSVSLFMHCLKDVGLTDDLHCIGDKKLLDQFYAGKLDIMKYYRFALQPLYLKTIKDLEQTIELYLTSYVSSHLYKEALDKIEELRSQNYKIIIVSATYDIVVKAIAERFFKADHVIATRVMYNPQGQILCDVYKDISHQYGKVLRIKELCQNFNYSLDNSIAFGDSVNDIPMLELAFTAIVINPAGNMAVEAKKRKWKILKWQETTNKK